MIPFRWAAVHLINSICLIQHAVEERKDKRITMIVGEFVWDAEKTMEILYLNSKSTEQEFSVFSQTIYYIYSVKLPTPKIRTHSTKSVPVAIVTKAKKLSREFITPHLTSHHPPPLDARAHMSTCQLGISHQQFGELLSTCGRERPLGVMTSLLLSEKLLEGTPTQGHVHVLVAWDNVALEMSQPGVSDPMRLREMATQLSSSFWTFKLPRPPSEMN